jgi:hypothetical protein
LCASATARGSAKPPSSAGRPARPSGEALPSSYGLDPGRGRPLLSRRVRVRGHRPN